MRHYICEHDTPVGEIVLFTDGEALTGAYLEGKKHFCGLAGNILKDSGKHPVLERAKTGFQPILQVRNQKLENCNLILKAAISDLKYGRACKIFLTENS